MKNTILDKLKNTRTIVTILLFLSAYVILIDTNSEKFIPLPYFFIEFGAITEIFSNGFRAENTKDYIIFIAMTIAHANLLFLMVKKASNWLTVFLPLVFILLLLSNNSNSIINYSNMALISLIPFFALWFLLIVVCFKNTNKS